MRKIIFLIITILYSLSVGAQFEWTPAKVIFNDGSSSRGFVKFPKHSGGLISIGSTKIKFRKKRKSTTEKFGNESVEEVVFGDEEFTTAHFKYVPIKKNKYVLMELIIEGKVNLFKRTVLKSTSTPSTNPVIPQNVTYYDDTQFFLFRNDGEKAKLIAGPNSIGLFSAKAQKYFDDCPKILEYIEAGLYNIEDLVQLVKDYNLLCD
ncbi:hypothetical protein [Winogradskyella sp. A3E31]|uniref:hypothetical protein n=1 Tax=Winogradskyella sp. A3E31 TaxID=3349637 RepID=UPI00398B784F